MQNSHAGTASTLLLVLAAACAPPPEPAAAPPPTTSAGPNTPPAPPACAPREACLEAAQAAENAGDVGKATTLYRAACDQRAGEACTWLARAERNDDPPKAIQLATRGCEIGDSRGCVVLGDLLVTAQRIPEAVDAYAKACVADDGVNGAAKGKVCGAAARGAYGAKDYARALDLATRGCGGERTGGCDTLGILYGNGEGVAKEPAKAAAAFAHGCTGGDREACKHQDQLASMNDPTAVEGANFRLGSFSADGFRMRDLECAMKGGGLEMIVAGPVIAAVIAKKKAALNACAPAGADIKVRWTARGTRVVDVLARAGDDKKVEACVERAIKSSIATFEATCRASFHIGK